MSGLLQTIDQFRLLGLTVLDLFAIIVVVLSTLLALFRGVSREALMLAAWLGAAACAWFAWPQVDPLLEPYITDDTVRMAAAIAAAFLVPLAVFLVIAGIMASLIENSFLSVVDRGLGVVFGAVRGVVLVLVTYLVLQFVFPTEQPAFIQEARLRPMLDEGIDVARSFAPGLPLPGETPAAAPGADERPPATPLEPNAEPFTGASPTSATESQ